MRGDGLRARKMALDRSTHGSCPVPRGEAVCAYGYAWAGSDGGGNVGKTIKRMKQIYMS